jgi:hypothetical protein
MAVMAFFVMAASSPQCARTSDDPSSGLQTLNTPDPVKVCQRDCAADARVATRVEKKRHRTAIKACDKDPICEAEEDAFHELVLLEIAADEAECKIACEHDQGAATGGQ